jgi:hypothetical protein
MVKINFISVLSVSYVDPKKGSRLDLDSSGTVDPDPYPDPNPDPGSQKIHYKEKMSKLS